MITYSDLKNTYHAEKRTSSLSKVNNDFYSDAQKLLTQVDDSHREHMAGILFEIYEIRKNKIMLSAARSHKPENLIPAEDEFYKEITNKLEELKGELLYVKTDIKEKEEIKEEDQKEEIKKPGEKEELEPEDKKQYMSKTAETGKIKVRIIKNIPAIIGSDLMHYELKENDEIELPKIDAKILIENKVAIMI